MVEKTAKPSRPGSLFSSKVRNQPLDLEIPVVVGTGDPSKKNPVRRKESAELLHFVRDPSSSRCDISQANPT